MDQILKHCKGVIGISDDITVDGHIDEKHDTKLCNIMDVTQEHGLVFSKDVYAVKASSIMLSCCISQFRESHHGT